MRALCLSILTVFGAGCSCAPFGLEGKTFACTSGEDCNDGYECRNNVCALVVDAGEGDAGEGDAGAVPDAGGDEDAGSDGGLLDPDAGAELATRLAFTSSPPLVHVGDCSPAFVIEARDDNDVTTPAVSAIPISLGSDGGVEFFATNSCASPVTRVTLAPGQSLASFYVKGSQGGPAQLEASAAVLAAATTVVTFAPDPDTLFFVAPLGSQFAGDCDVLNLEARKGTTPQPVAVNTDITFTTTPSSGSRIYSDAACSTQITRTTIVAGSASANVYVRTISGGANVITADAPWDSTQISINTTGLVRRVGCGFSDATYFPDGGVNTTQLATSCQMIPRVKDYNRTVVLQNSWGTVGAISAGQAKCRIDTSSSSQLINCQRRGHQGRLSALMHAMEIPGASVRRISLNCAVPSAMGTTTPTLDPDSTFVLKTLMNDGYGLDDEETAWTWLDSGMQVSLNMPAGNPCVAAELQLVQIPGISVVRGELDGSALGAGETSFTLSGLPDAGPNRVVLVQPSTSATTENVSFCNVFVRAEVPTGNTMTLSRGIENSACAWRAVDHIAWQRIDFGNKAKVDAYTVQMDAGVTVMPVTVNAVDPTRSFVFTGTELGFGQNGGESDSTFFASGGEVNANFGMDGGTQVMVQRGSANSTARYTFYVVQWNL